MKINLLVVASLCLPASAYAATERDLESHVHGGASLNMAFDANTLFVEFGSPWNNLVGFEHKPSTDEQRQAVESALEQLNQADQLFTFNGTACAISEVTIDSSLGEDHDEHAEDGDHEEHADEDHDEHAEDDNHEEHADEDHDEHASHSSVLVSYTFDCTDANELESIEVGLFALWSGIEEVNAQLIGPAGQALQVLTQENVTLDLSSLF